MRHWTSLNAFADETGVEAVWLSLVLQIICAYWRCHSNQTETGVCACVRARVRVCVLLWGYFPRWLQKSALWFIGAEEPCGYSSHARGDACLSAITASAHYVLIVAASSVLYKQKTAYFLVFAVVRVLCVSVRWCWAEKHVCVVVKRRVKTLFHVFLWRWKVRYQERQSWVLLRIDKSTHDTVNKCLRCNAWVGQ